MGDTVTIDFSKPIPLFPLPNSVLLPYATIPLHIFEVRYRRMVHDALDRQGLIAMAVFQGNQWKSDYEGNPAIRPHVCVGCIVRHERLVDGRYNMLLQGLCRARIDEELVSDQHPYRRALLAPTEPQSTMEIDLTEHRQQIESLLNDPYMKQLASVTAIHNWLTPNIPTSALIDLTVMSICEDVDSRYEILAEPSATARARWLQRFLQTTRRTLAIAARFEPEDRDDDLCLN
jgi:uncharacterized protein